MKNDGRQCFEERFGREVSATVSKCCGVNECDCENLEFRLK